MVPSEHASEVLRLFFAIPSSRIDEELEGCPDNFEPLYDLVLEHSSFPEEELTLESHAENLHHQMVQAYAAWKHPLIPECVAYFFASKGAHAVVEPAWSSAEQGGELRRQQDEIKRFEQEGGIDEDDDDPNVDHLSESYHTLVESSNEMLMKIEQLVISDVLRRYKLHPVADLYEEDEAEFASRAEAGRKIVHPSIQWL